MEPREKGSEGGEVKGGRARPYGFVVATAGAYAPPLPYEGLAWPALLYFYWWVCACGIWRDGPGRVARATCFVRGLFPPRRTPRFGFPRKLCISRISDRNAKRAASPSRFY